MSGTSEPDGVGGLSGVGGPSEPGAVSGMGGWSPRRQVLACALASGALKVLLAAWLPVTSDEAYFTLWAKTLEAGYYDHPPMVGWLLWLLAPLGQSPVALRATAIVGPILVGLGLYALFRHQDEPRAAWLAMLFLASPLNLFNVLVTTDTPLFVFCFAATALLWTALRSGRRRHFVWAGALLGCAFLSKYFALLLVPAFTVALGRSWRAPGVRLGALLLAAAFAPFVAVNVAWNATHCWANVMFNVFNRNADSAPSWTTVALFVLTQLYLAGPPLVWLAASARGRPAAETALERGPGGVFALAFAVPLAGLALLSPVKLVGLHWSLAFYPMLYAALFASASVATLRRALVGMVAFSAVHAAVALALLATPADVILATPVVQRHPRNAELALLLRARELVAALEPYRARYELAAVGYGDAALLAYYSGAHVPVFGVGSKFARHDDSVTSWLERDGADLAIVTTRPPPDDDLLRYFEQVERRTVDVGDSRFSLTLGHGFRASPYRERVLTEIRRRYYAIPEYLPHPPGTCPFMDRNFR